MAAYETVIILDPALNDEQAQEQFDDIKRRLTEDVGGQIVVEDHWGRRKLAYEIERKTEGNYMFYRFSRDNLAERIDFTEFERHLRFAESVVRYMIIRIADEDLTSPVIRPEVFSYSSRPSRGPRPDRFSSSDGDRKSDDKDDDDESTSSEEASTDESVDSNSDSDGDDKE